MRDRNCSPSKLFINLLRSTPRDHLEDSSPRTSTNSSSSYMSSSSSSASPCIKSPWTHTSTADHYVNDYDEQQKPSTGLIGTLTREQGHLYSLAAHDDLLYTGSDSKNIRVWRSHQEFSAFKSSSGLVKAIVISQSGDAILIFTGHQDGKIRAWRQASDDDDTSAVTHKRAGTLPTLKDFVTSFSMKPWWSSYVRVRHFDAVSCLSLDEEAGLLYSGSWDKTIKVWRIHDYKCLDSVTAHDDAINSVAVGFDGLVFSGSADGTVKMWRREMRRRKKKDRNRQMSIRHVLVMTLMRQETAVTALAVAGDDGVVYCGSSDGLINFWVRDGPRRLAHGGAIRGHKMAVLCLTAEGRIVFSGSADGTVRVWSRAEGCKSGPAHHRIAVLTGHSAPVKCLAVVEEEEEEVEDGAQGRRWVVYSGSLDKTVKIWRVVEQAEEEAAASSHVMRRVRHVMGERGARF